MFFASLIICGPTRNRIWSTESSEVEGCYIVLEILLEYPTPFSLVGYVLTIDMLFDTWRTSWKVCMNACGLS